VHQLFLSLTKTALSEGAHHNREPNQAVDQTDLAKSIVLSRTPLRKLRAVFGMISDLTDSKKDLLQEATKKLVEIAISKIESEELQEGKPTPLQLQQQKANRKEEESKLSKILQTLGGMVWRKRADLPEAQQLSLEKLISISAEEDKRRSEIKKFAKNNVYFRSSGALLGEQGNNIRDETLQWIVALGEQRGIDWLERNAVALSFLSLGISEIVPLEGLVNFNLHHPDLCDLALREEGNHLNILLEKPVLFLHLSSD
jgi:hypothetical protein